LPVVSVVLNGPCFWWYKLVEGDVDLYALCHEIFNLFEFVELVFPFDIVGAGTDVREVDKLS
jgi:hypothetical protein